MWDDVVIGKGNKGASSRRVWDVPGGASISANSVSFWISGCLLGVGMTIFKATAEGKELMALIENEAALEKREVQDWLDRLVLRHLDPERLKSLINRANEEAFANGMRAKAAEMRAVLEC